MAPRGSTVSTSPARRETSTRTILIVLAAALLALVAVAAVLVVIAPKASAANVTMEPMNAAGANPFLPSVAKQQTPVAPPPGTGGSFPADTPGLYGGTRNNASCDGPAMVAFLQNDPAKAAAWAGVLGITPADIPSYVAGLTPVVLRSDTYVTNHGYADGRATTLISVLHAGTAVFVDQGSPRLRSRSFSRPPSSSTSSRSSTRPPTRCSPALHAGADRGQAPAARTAPGAHLQRHARAHPGRRRRLQLLRRAADHRIVQPVVPTARSAVSSPPTAAVAAISPAGTPRAAWHGHRHARLQDGRNSRVTTSFSASVLHSIRVVRRRAWFTRQATPTRCSRR
ncbi:MAG: hypothetical protein L0K86_23445 [Actinomycetia bacterium]|nr:hypothetical protein [Actinomycetes bacterium]